MKITKNRLKKIVKEEIELFLKEVNDDIDVKVDSFLRSYCKENKGIDPDFDDVKAHFSDSHIASEVWNELRDMRKPCS
jgi:hypothetical protein